MTTSLETVVKNADSIQTACACFGFSNPRLYGVPDNYLCLSVETAQTENQPHEQLKNTPARVRMNMLAFYLTEYFQCEAVVYSAEALGSEEGYPFGEGAQLRADPSEVKRLFKVDSLGNKLFDNEASDTSTPNRLQEKRRNSNLSLIKSLGLPLAPTVQANTVTSPLATQPTFFYETENKQKQHAVEIIANNLRLIIDSDPKLKADVEQNAEAVFNTLMKIYDPSASTQLQNRAQV